MRSGARVLHVTEGLMNTMDCVYRRIEEVGAAGKPPVFDGHGIEQGSMNFETGRT